MSIDLFLRRKHSDEVVVNTDNVVFSLFIYFVNLLSSKTIDDVEVTGH